MASLEEEAIPVLQGNQDEMATRDFQAPREKRVHQETLAPGETKGKKEWLGLQGPLGPLGPGALLATLGKMAPREHQAQRAQTEPRGPRASLAFLERREMMGHRASQVFLDPQGPRGNPASEGLTERQGCGVSRASRASRETRW